LWSLYHKRAQHYSIANRIGKPILGGYLHHLNSLKSNTQTEIELKILCTFTRNFTNTSLRKVFKRNPAISSLVKKWFTRFWAALKLASLLEPSVKSLCYFLLRNSYSVEFQALYKDTLDEISESRQFVIGNFDDYNHRSKNHTPIQIELIDLLKEVEPELWFPTRLFPRIEYEKESKMKYAFVPFNATDTLLSEFRQLVKDYLKSLNLFEIFKPPPDLVLKVSSSRYNDGGTVKRDYEKPTKSFSSGFLYQKFWPKPLEPREVWLPDMSTKINNSFWMLIGRQILKSDPTYPKSDPEETWEEIRKKLTWFCYFDISGFGFQYPREYLIIVAECICELYSDPDMQEYLNIFKHLLKNVKVQMPDGTFKYPPRGIGLGYYEDLKTIGMNAILRKFKPISVYGDQGLIPANDSTFMDPILELRRFLFILNDDKFLLMRGAIRWSGWTMAYYKLRRPKQTFEPITSLFHAQYHWERKLILRSLFHSDPHSYNRYDHILPYQYELFFGYEVSKGDSLWNFRNGGVSSLSLVRTGLLKGWAYEKLISPSDTIVDDVIYESPFFTDWKRSDAKEFSILRKKTFKNSIPSSTEIRDYANPIYTNLDTRKPTLNKLASLISDSQESKLIVNYCMTTGKFTSGLNADAMKVALSLCSVSRNPFYSHSRGGVRIETVYRGIPRVSSEWIDLYDILTTRVSMIHDCFIKRYSYEEALHEFYSDLSSMEKAKRLNDNVGDVTPNKVKKNKISTDSLSNFRITLNTIKKLQGKSDNPEILKSAKNLFQDIDLRSGNVPIVEDEPFLYEDEVLDDVSYLVGEDELEY
jgi:hypothetical protein